MQRIYCYTCSIRCDLIVLERADITSIEAMLLKIQLHWAGHVSRMADHRLPKIILYGELSSGLRNRGAPKKRCKDTLKKSLGACNISHHEWITLAKDRGAWRRTISKAASSFESSHRSAIEENDRGGKTVQLQHQTPSRPLPAVTVTGLVDPA